MSDFDEWWDKNTEYYEYKYEAAEDAWNYQQAKIDAQQKRITELEALLFGGQD